MKKLLLKLAFAGVLLSGMSAKAQTTLFTEDFSSGALPSGWTNDSLGLPAFNLWTFFDNYGRAVTGANFDANYAIFDSDQGLTNDGIPELAQLTTSSINIAGATTGLLYLEMDEQYRALAGPSTAGSARQIEVSSDGGTTWNTLVYDSVDVGYPNAVTSYYNISSYIGNASIKVRFTWTGDWDWWWAIDNFKVVNYPPCTVAPISGTISGQTLTCTGVDFSLTVSGGDTGPLLSYQWYSSSDNVNFQPISGANSTTLTTNQGDTTYYYVTVSCGSLTSTSSTYMVGMDTPANCFCVPSHISCAGGVDYISNVQIVGTTLNNSSGCDELNGPAYTAWWVAPNTVANLIPNTAYDFSVTTEADNIISIWIDFNLDGTFAPDEWTQVCITSLASTPNVVNWTIPSTATTGVTKMRVRSRAVNNPNGDVDACTPFFSGENEDYVVGINFPSVGLSSVSTAEFGIFPNPAKSDMNIIFQQTVAKGEISIFNSQGALVGTYSLENVFSKRIDVSSLTEGVYFARLTDGKTQQTKSFVVSR